MEYKTKFPGLMHFNREELLCITNKNEKNIKVLLDTFFQELPESIKRIRYSVKKQDEDTFKYFVNQIAISAKAVCFDILEQLAKELSYQNIDEPEAILELLDEIEVERECIKDLLKSNLEVFV